MATFQDPLLFGNTTRKSFHWKTFSLVVFFVSVIAFAILFSTNISVSISHNNATKPINNHDHQNSRILLQMFLNKSVLNIKNMIDFTKHVNRQINDPRENMALDDCVELMNMSMDMIRDSILALENSSKFSHSNAHTWLSSVLTFHVTCLDGLNGASARPIIEAGILDLISNASSSLAMLVAISPMNDEVFEALDGNLPSWVNRKDQKLLENFPMKGSNADVVVAKDGSGNYTTLNEAIESAPENSNTRYVIYIKNGTYEENVVIGSRKRNLMITGDGMDLTIITGSLNFVDGTTTFNTPTVAVNSAGFIAQDIWFQNTAGPSKHQAVALRITGDQAVINRCKMDAYQDTLYTHANRQFYRDCYITGTIDFIFGYAAVVLQNSQIVARKPNERQTNMVTAQGRTDPNQNTGISIQNCEIIASSDLAPVLSSFKSYLGRPWEAYSRTVVMQSSIGDLIDPAGWAKWNDNESTLSTLYYGEYMNSGPGAGTSERVDWPGFHVITSADEAENFTVAQLIEGASWISAAGVDFIEGLSD